MLAALTALPALAAAQAVPPDMRPPSSPPPVTTPDGPGPRRGGSPLSPGVGLNFTFNLGGGQRPRAPAQNVDQVPDQVIVLVRADGGQPAAIAQAGGGVMIEATTLQSVALVMIVVQLPPGDTPDAAIARFQILPGVAWAQANQLFLGAAAASATQPRSAGVAAPAAPSSRAGVVAVIDTPVAINHEAFTGVLVQQQVYGPTSGAAAHGTAVAGILASQRPMRLVSLAAFEQPPGAAGPVSQTRYLAKALDAASTLRPNVLNLSFGGPGDRLLEALLAALDGRGVCIVAAGGNGGRRGRPPFPAIHPAVLGVTAVDTRGRVYRDATPGSQVDVAAPGVEVLVPVLGGYRTMSGSSFAAAAVSGSLGHLPACQRFDPAAMRAAVAAAAQDLGRKGRDDVFGAGLFRLPPS